MSGAKSWTAAEESYLRAHYPTESTHDIAKALDRSYPSVRSRAKKRGLRKGGPLQRQTWSEAEQVYLRAHYADEPTAALAERLGRPLAKVYSAAHRMGLEKSQAFLRAHCRLQAGHQLGRATQFPKGHVPANKGLRRPGYSVGRGRMQETQFQKGERSGVAVDLWKPIGTERLSKDGYLQRKINNDLPLQRRWRAVHLILWEAVNGPLPAGHAVAFINGDKRDIRLDNLELISRAELMRRNTVHHLPPELKDTIQMTGRLKRAIRRKERERANEKSA